MRTFIDRYVTLWNTAAGALPAISTAAPPVQLTGPPGDWWIEHVQSVHTDALSDPARLIAVEYLYCYFLELGRVFDALDVICRRFAPTRTPPPAELARFDVSPLHTVGELLWGYSEDEEDRTKPEQRRLEYRRQYGLDINGYRAPLGRSREGQPRFLQYLHTLLHACARYYRESDDNTITANAFPVLSALRPLHMLLAESAHNQFQFITSKVRLELWVIQQILSLTEIRQFLGAPLNVPYPAHWMGSVDTLRRIMRWGDVSITEFYNLAQLSEVILLTVRYGPFRPNFNDAAAAGAWAQQLRNSVEQYIYSYQAITGVNLGADTLAGRIDATPPSVYLNAREENARLRLRAL